MSCWPTLECLETTLGLVIDICFVMSGQMLISILSILLEPLCSEAADALVSWAGDLKPNNLSPLHLMCVFKKLKLA